MKIQGIDKLQRDLKEAEMAMKEIDGLLGEASFDPEDPASIDVAVQAAHRMIDDKMGPYARNPLVGPMIEETKEHFRQAIIEQAQAHRLGKQDD
ncbi:hypothetical protein GCM10016234_35000 [Tianweitania populi]|uniref:Uncharacterized protein n=2 Tax=Tianweitania populi TaxID=1607949 RepID=A0A8J3DSM8_9HYPH|nr:hypothetical protein GCM10016234_35000 [Tianweitania populi]